MSNLTDLISAGGGVVLETIFIGVSQTWTPPVDGTARIHVIGGGASGMSDGNTNSGGAGGYARKDVTLSTGTNWTFVVGSGGEAAHNTGSTAGGQSTASDGSFTMAGNGAGTNRTGGTAYGGTVNYTGGQGSNGPRAGGGAVSLLSSGSGDASYGQSGGASATPNAGGFQILGLGQITGGRGGAVGGESGQIFAGGGMGYGGGSNGYEGGYSYGGNGGTGAGGGGTFNNQDATDWRQGGNGGDGIIIIQYLTVS